MANYNQHPSYLSCVADILSSSETPLTVDALVARIQAMRPVGKGARSAVYQAISKLYQAISVAPGQFGWLSYLLDKQSFRHPLNAVEMRRGFLLLDELEHAVFFPEFFQSHEPNNRKVRVELMGGPILKAQTMIERGVWSLRLGIKFAEWVDLMGGSPYDDLLIWVNDAVKGSYGMRLQPREARQEEVIVERNKLLVQLAEDIVSSDRKSRDAVPSWELAATLIGRGLYAHPVPPDDMHYVLHEQSRLVLVDDLGYVLDRQASVLPSRHGNARGHSEGDSGEAGDLPWSARKSEWSLLKQEFLDQFLDDEATSGEGIDEDLFDDELIDEDELFGLVHELIEEDSDEASEHCESYQSYLTEFYTQDRNELPLSHMDFHLLEAELEMLVGLDHEFGYLMEEQEARKNELSNKLYIDTNFFYNDGDWDQSDYDDPPFWEDYP